MKEKGLKNVRVRDPRARASSVSDFTTPCSSPEKENSGLAASSGSGSYTPDDSSLSHFAPVDSILNHELPYEDLDWDNTDLDDVSPALISRLWNSTMTNPFRRPFLNSIIPFKFNRDTYRYYLFVTI